jgi:HSP20 family protein
MDDRKLVLRNDAKEPILMINPFREMDDIFNSFRRDMDRMLWDPLGFELPRPRMRAVRAAQFMPMNLEDAGEKLVLSVEMPGINKDDTKISLEEDILTISVDSKEDKEDKQSNFLLRERSSFSCQRSVRLPIEVMGDKVSAKMDNGVLHVELPKKHPKEPVKNEIKIE